MKDYEADDFKDQVEVLWEQVKPLYLQLHAYVRRRLREQYGEEHVSKRGPIPAHLLGLQLFYSFIFQILIGGIIIIFYYLFKVTCGHNRGETFTITVYPILEKQAWT